MKNETRSKKIWGAGTSLNLGLALILGGCGSASTSGSSTEDASTSGTVAAAVGGVNSSSGSSGALSFYNEPALKMKRGFLDFIKSGLIIPEAMASATCPTIGGSASGCTASGSALTMSYGTTTACSFGKAAAGWIGSQIITFSAVTPTCTSFPSSYTGTLTRTFGSGTVRTAASGASVAIDTLGTVTAADGHSYTGGTVVTFSSGSKTQIAIAGLNYTGYNAAGTKTYSHTLTTAPVGGSSTPLTIASGVVNGTVTVFHNLAKVQATSTLSSVTHTDGCCQPTSGTITTAFAAISGVTTTSKLVGTSETLTFTGCGTATYSGSDGTSGSVTLAHCL